MLKVIIDTNVIISAALSPKGNAARIINIIDDNQEIQIFFSSEILDEYKEVLSRERLNIKPEAQICIINTIIKVGMLIKPTGSEIPLPDESDRIFYDAALEAGATLITGNKKHYPAENFIVTPAEFLSIWCH